MKHDHDNKRRRVSEPVQVYLGARDRGRLERLAEQMDATKSDVLRRALEALEQQLMDPASHPALRIIGIAGDHPRHPSPGYDEASEHDRFLAEAEEASWSKRTERRVTGKAKPRAARKRG